MDNYNERLTATEILKRRKKINPAIEKMIQRNKKSFAKFLKPFIEYWKKKNRNFL